MWLNSIISRVAFLLVLIGILTAKSIAHASGPVSGYPHCYLIDTFPYTVTGPGVYCLAHKIIDYPLTTSSLITIKSDNVVLDLNGSTLLGDSSRFKGLVYAISSAENKNVIVRNGTISGFDIGVSLTHYHNGVTEDSQIMHGLKTENLRLYRNKITALRIEGNGSEIIDNQILGNGGNLNKNGFVNSYGIYTSGNNLRIINNNVGDIRIMAKVEYLMQSH